MRWESWLCFLNKWKKMWITNILYFTIFRASFPMFTCRSCICFTKHIAESWQDMASIIQIVVIMMKQISWPQLSNKFKLGSERTDSGKNYADSPHFCSLLKIITHSSRRTPYHNFIKQIVHDYFYFELNLRRRAPWPTWYSQSCLCNSNNWVHLDVKKLQDKNSYQISLS